MKIRHTGRCGFVACTAFAALVASAQTPAPTPAATPTQTSEPPASTLPAVTVSGPRFKLDIPAEELPQTVSSITSGDIEARTFRSVEEALSQLSSVQPGLAGRAGYDEFMIRGFFQSAYQFKNGLRLDPGYNQQEELFGLERIDVLKGPSSVEYGQIAPGGVVNLVSKTPQPAPLREIGIEFGSFRAKRLSVDLGDRIDAAGTWSFRVPIVISDAGDFQDHVYSRRRFAAPTVAYRPDARTELVVYTVVQTDDFRRSTSVPYALAGKVDRSTYLGEPSLPAFTRPQTQLGYAFERRFDDGWRFTQRLRQTQYHERGTSLYASSWTDTSYTPGYYYFDYQVDVLSLDHQLQKTLKTGAFEHDLLAGYDLMDYGSRMRGVGGETAALDLRAPVSTPTTIGPLPDEATKHDIGQRGLYAQYRLKFDERVGLNLGARRSKVSDDNGGTRTTLSKNTYSAGLMLFDLAGFSPYASYSQSFEPITGWDPYLYDGSRPPPFSEGSQRELGVKWRSADGRHTAVASYFDLYQTHIYNYVGFGTDDGCAVADNACDAASDQRHKGIELEVQSRWGRVLDLHAGFTHLDARIAKTQLATATGAVGSRPFGIPRNTLTATAVLHGAAVGVNGLDLSLGLRHVGERLATQAGGTLPAYTLLDVGIAYPIGPARLYAAVKNLSDRRTLLGPYFGNVSYGAPRSLTVGLQYAL